jgi:hypothetical protein
MRRTLWRVVCGWSVVVMIWVFLVVHVSAIDWDVLKMMDSTHVLVMSDTAQADANVKDSVVSPWYGTSFLPQAVGFEYGLWYMNESCSLGVDNDSGAPFWVVETRQHPSQAPKAFILDSMHNERDSLVYFRNDFADGDDTLWGTQFRVKFIYEMDCDSASSGTDEVDSVKFNKFWIWYYDGIE